jgi:NADH dehydrogenase FAD-containing subunit
MYIISQLDIYVLVPQYVNIYDTMWPMSIIAVGSQPNTFGIPEVQEHALFLKEAEDSAKLHAQLLGNLEKAAALSYQGDRYKAEIDRLLKVIVVGGGPTGMCVSVCLICLFQQHHL